MENMEDFCVSHNYTQRDLLLLLLCSSYSSFTCSLPSHLRCKYIVFQNWESSSWNSFLLETMQVGIKFTISFISLSEIPQWERGHPWSTTQQPRTYPKTTNFCVIIKGANKMVGKGQITRDSSSSMLLIGLGRPREHPNGLFRCNGSTRADIAQLPVAHAYIQGNPKGVRWPLLTTGNVS